MLQIIVGNPYVSVPNEVLNDLFREAGQDTRPVPVCGSINGRIYKQTLVKYSGAWRLYINLQMLDDSPRRIGETVRVAVSFDPADRTITPHPKLVAALRADHSANAVFESLAPSRQKEIVRYIDGLKSEASVDRNVERAVEFLLGRGRFVGRDHP